MTYAGNPEQRDFVKAAMRAPLLDADHEKMLARRWIEQEDERALHELTGAYMRLVCQLVDTLFYSRLCIAQLVDCAHGHDGGAKVPVFQSAPLAQQDR